MKIKNILIAGLFLFSVCQTAWAATPPPKTITLQKKGFSTILYFNGNVKPIRMINVTSPADGVIVGRYFEYGQKIAKGDQVVQLNSEALEKNFHDALTAYLKAKSSFQEAQSKYNASAELWKLGIVAKDDLTSTKNQMDFANLSYFEALYSLEKSIKVKEVLPENIKQLTVNNINQIEKTLNIKYNMLTVASPADGVVLFNPQQQGGDSPSNKKIQVGSVVKLGQVIILIGDMSGLSIDIVVDEIDIDRVKVGQKVFVTSEAFPEFKLQGQIRKIDSQASSASGGGGGLPVFPVSIEIPSLTSEELGKIRVGMSAKVELVLENPNSFSVPLGAVSLVDGQSVVKLIRNGKVEQVPVVTGETGIDVVEVKNGLAVGDQIVVGE
ncbi:MAG: efflux RND transporter periplasmic adaptor subunit [Proteobacteria bacterium]|nr:efflux RND transporter periplasmic adaptor subunit [Pseudomonadota bacterium]